MHVTVEDGHATAVKGDPDHPVTHGFLCGKVSNYLDRVYSDQRLLHPLVREDGELRRASWDEALDVAAAGIRQAIDTHGGESLLPYSYAGTQGLVQGNLMSQRVMNALGASELVRTICASAGMAGVGAAHGMSPEVDPEEWPHARYLLLWGWNPMSTAPHLWRLLLEAQRGNGARLVVVDPRRSKTARLADEHVQPLPGTDAALGLGMMRAIRDAGLVDEDWCRAHTTGLDELLERLDDFALDRCAEITQVPAEQIERVALDFAHTQPALLRLGVGAQRHLGAPAAYSTLASLPALVGAWRHRGGGCSYIPTATAAAISSVPPSRPDLRAGDVRRINMSQLGDALCGDLDPPVKALVVWNSNPAQVAPDQTKVLAGLARADLFTVVLEQFMTDTAAHADVVLPATTQLEHLDVIFSWGHHYVTLSRPAIEPRDEAKPNTEIFRLLAARLGLDDPCFSDSDEELVEQVLATAPSHVKLDGLAERGWAKVDLGQGELPHAEGGFGTADGKLHLHAVYEPPAEVADVELATRFPLALITPKTHLFLNSTFANQERQHAAQPKPFVVVHPDDAGPRGLAARARVFNDRGSFVADVQISDETRPGVVVAPMGWWSGDYEGGVGAQATTPQLLTESGQAPTFNDNRVELEPA
jgi:anaerobic selenocysteine-containing dehydrogenase